MIGRLIGRFRDYLAERRIRNGLEHVFRTYLMEAELGRDSNEEPIPESKPTAYYVPSHDDRLAKRKAAREDDMRLVRSIEEKIKRSYRSPIESLTARLEEVRQYHRSRIVHEYLKRPAIAARTAHTFIDRLAKSIPTRTYAQGATADMKYDARLQALEDRLDTLDVKLNGYATRKGYGTVTCPAKAYIPKYDSNRASSRMRETIIKQYSTDYSRSLKAIANDISARYGMNVSESTMRRIARKELGNVSRRDRSAQRAYSGKHHAYGSGKFNK